MIFEEPTGRRRRQAQRCLIALIGFLALLLAVACLNALISPSLPKLAESSPTHRHATIVSEPLGKNEPVLPGPSTPPANIATSAIATTPAPATAASSHSLFSSPFVRCAFVVNDDPESVSDLIDHLPQVQVVFPDFFTFSTDDGTINTKPNDALVGKLLAAGVTIIPRISNTDASGNWKSDILREIFTSSSATDQFIDQLLAGLAKVHARGVNLDIESIDVGDKRNFVNWLDTVAAALHQKQLALTVDVPAFDDAFDYEAIGSIADAVVLMAYDQHYATGKPGPIAGKQWFSDCVDDGVSRIDPSKLIVGMGVYGYDWTGGKRGAEALGFSDAMLLAQQNGAEIQTDKDAVNSYFKYQDDGGRAHEVWLLDAVSCWNQYVAASRARVRGVALWRTGLEEQAIWKFYGRNGGDDFDPNSLAVVDAPDEVSFDGDGEVLHVQSTAQPGSRYLTFDGDTIDYATYTTVPTPFLVQRFGRSAANQIALTFDDGPDPNWTPKVLDILKRNGVRATFFLVGQQAGRFPQIVQDEFAAGHLLGNHTYSHANLRHISPFWLRIELNSTQRMIESITHHDSLLFRPPYDADTEPTFSDELSPLYDVGKSGYLVVGANVDSDDYDRPGVERIVQNVMGGLSSEHSNVIVFHDAGGDRSQTVAALAQLIPLLKSQGYQFIGINDLLGQSAANVMPAVPGSEHVLVYGNSFLMGLEHWSWRAVVVLFALTTVISIIRILGLGVLVMRSVRRRDAGVVEDFQPPVRVLIPAFNESKVIERTLDSVLASTYPNLAVTVVDDGSTDGTADIVRAYSLREERVTLLEQENSGKACALNNGFASASEDYIVTIDADTIITPQTVAELVRRFADPIVDAVCGNVQVGNVHSLLTAFQHVEYVTSQNYDRRAFDHLNCIAVVPGATGAWRREKVLALGGYSTDTLTEDADLTLSLLSSGGKIVYAPLATSITEAPETVRTLFRQRFRWSFGTLQCLWKYRRRAFRGTLGWIALPNMFLFQLLFPLLSPLGDIILLMCLFRRDFSAVAAGYVLFLIMDLTGSLIALRLDRRNLRDAWVVLIQRFYYRQFMYVVTIAALIAGIGGRRHGWNKLHRTGSVRSRSTPAPAPARKPLEPALLAS